MTMQDPKETEAELIAAVAGAETPEALEQVRVGALGRKGRVTELMKSLGKILAATRLSAFHTARATAESCVKTDWLDKSSCL